MRASALSVLLVLLCLCTNARAEAFDPSRTFVLIVGVLQWDSPNIPGFPTVGRQDSELSAVLRERGVPQDHIRVLLDEAATLQNILAALAELGQRAGKNDTLFFYYAGHGVRRNDKVQFLNYDWTPQRALGMEQLSQAIQQTWPGDRVMLFADCCFSGGLSQVATELAEAGIPSLALTSASALIPSQANWTFTMALNDALRGLRWTDQHNDRRITLDDLATTIQEAMEHSEHQASSYHNCGIPESLLLATVQDISAKPRIPEPFSAYQAVQVWWQGQWQPARILSFDGDSFQAEIQRYHNRETVEVQRSDIRKVPEKPILLDDATALSLANPGGKYQNLLFKFKSENDYLNYLGFREIGYRESTDYGSETSLPAGYWVYLYPNWYIWEKERDESRDPLR